MKKETEKGKHLMQDKRIEIEMGLNAGMPFKAIARKIDKDPTTVYNAKYSRTCAACRGISGNAINTPGLPVM